MDIEQQAKIIDTIHDTLAEHVGERLRVRANMGRSKIVESEGTLTQVHPQLFILEVDRKRGRTSRQSYQYVDVLTGMVELSQGGSPLFESFFEDEDDLDSQI
ncbi:MAG: Veg family protein [Eggerthellales bacterium]|nr:Veg family protein [Eggerthellales bacterium]